MGGDTWLSRPEPSPGARGFGCSTASPSPAQAVAGERGQALLATLAAASGRVVGATELVERVWRDDPPANPGKALQVLVSRVRSQTTADIVEWVAHGYRLALPAEDVDVLRLGQLAKVAVRAEAEGDQAGAVEAARSALALGMPSGGEDGPVADLHDRAERDRATAVAVLGRRLSAEGAHEEALGLLESVHEPDEVTLAALLRSEAAVRGTPMALRRYEAHRSRLRESLGADPGPALRAVHAELLASDNPRRSGLHFEATSLVGRDADIRALRALVREARVTTIYGPGGIGKTRLAHLLAREAEQPVVHVVELVGIASPDDVVGELGSALDVRDSVSAAQLLTPEQLRDVRARAAQELGRVPTLLVLDNCEHVVEAVAELVAFLVAAVPRLRVVTTSRAPLSIAAERIFPLGQLGEDDAAALFVERARAARPGASVDDDAVRRVVTRLDGLPLAIELAAARVRAMSVDDIAARLDDRFALLRGGDRSAPDRHQTLLAVIDWSWNLLADTERRALSWLSLFHDGFTLATAEAMLGGDALDIVESLVEQSLLTVAEGPVGLRYRMLETVREFGRMRLRDGGEQDVAMSAQRSWATAYAGAAVTELYSPRQPEVLDGLRAEENNLADLLRRATRTGDIPTVIPLMAALGGFWLTTGEHARLLSIAMTVDDALDGWVPDPELVELGLAVACLLALSSTLIAPGRTTASLALIERYGDEARAPVTVGMVRLLRAVDPTDLEASLSRLSSLREDPDRWTASLALLWSSHASENAGDPVAAIGLADRALALWRETDGPASRASLLAQLSILNAQLGRLIEASRHAAAAVPLLDRLGAVDDAVGVRLVLACSAVVDGRLDDADALMAEVQDLSHGRALLSPGLVAVDAELAMARGDRARGLDLYRASLARLEAMRLPSVGSATGGEPWVVFGVSTAATAYAVHATGSDGRDLFDRLTTLAGPLLQVPQPRLDFPVAGMALFALGAWGLLRDALPVEDSLRLLDLALAFGYNRIVPSMAWDVVAGPAERLAPGRLVALAEARGGRAGADLLEEARALVAGLSPC